MDTSKTCCIIHEKIQYSFHHAKFTENKEGENFTDAKMQTYSVPDSVTHSMHSIIFSRKGGPRPQSVVSRN